jgi:flagellar biosynthesis protein FlhA
MSLTASSDVYTKLSVGDGLVTQVPALIVSLAAGLLVSKGGNRGSTEKAVFGQLGHYPRALMVAALLMAILAVTPGLPFVPFILLGAAMAFVSYAIPKRLAETRAAEEAKLRLSERQAQEDARQSVKESLKIVEIELCLGKQLATQFLAAHGELASRAKKMRRKFASQYGFVVPDIKLSDDLMLPPKRYQIKIHGTVCASGDLRIGEILILIGDRRKPDIPGDEVHEPSFGMQAMWIPELFANEARREGFVPIDNISVLLTHLSEVIRGNLSQLLSYRDMRALLDRLEPEYKRLIDEICPAQISYSGLQAVLKLLLAERVSVRNLNLILESIAEIAPHARRPEQIVEHVRMRIAPQIWGDLVENGVLKVLRLGNRWELAFHQSLKRDAKGEVVEFDIDPRMIEQFGADASKAVRTHLDRGERFVLVTAPDARPYVRMIIERLFPTLPVLSHVEIARGVQIGSLGTIS